MLDTQANGGVYIQVFYLFRREKPYLCRLFTHPKLTPNDPARETQRELLTYFSVGESYHVVRVRVDPHNILRLYLKPRLFPRLAYGRLNQCLPDFHSSTRQGPYSGVAPLLKQDFPLSFTTTVEAEGTRLLIFGAFGSFK